MKNNKEFKTVEWVRKIRDNNANKFKDFNMKEFAMGLSQEAKRSEFWKELKSKKAKIN